MEQRIPNITDVEIRRIVERDFPKSEFSAIERILEAYKSESKKGWNRICASILKLSDGSVDLIKEYVTKANIDYRDVVSLAEYPNYIKVGFNDNLSEEQKSKLIETDWMQYQAWLNKV